MVADQSDLTQLWFKLFIGGAGLVIAAVVVFTGWYIWHSAGGLEVTLPLIIIIGVVVLLIVLGLVTVCFSVLNLANAGQPLGLPEGSVRAVIALMLLVLFAIVAIFLFDSVSKSGKIESIANQTAEQVGDFLTKTAQVISVQPALDAGKPELRYTVYYRLPNPASDDIAKQLIVLLGTLVTAVSSFYFGANSVQSAVAKRDAAPPTEVPARPGPTGFDPASLTRDGSPQKLAITGSNLASVNKVELRKDGTSISATIKGATANRVDCLIVISSNQTSGDWDVFVDDGKGELKAPDPIKLI
jgi:hypothetical protein